jgi:ribonucleoside-diphosphate reductase alpha chain
VMDIFIEAWRLGLKAVAIYRDGCKRTQPLNTSKEAKAVAVAEAVVAEPRPVRRRLPDERQAVCHKFDVAGHEGYIHVGFFEDGQPGEIFIKMAKEGSTISGLMDTIATLTSLSLQYGVPLDALVGKFSHMRFEPSGFTKNAEIPMAKSLIDYIFRYMGSRFLSAERKKEIGIIEREEPVAASTSSSPSRPSADLPGGGTATAPVLRLAPIAKAPEPTSSAPFAYSPQADAPTCPDCGAIMIRNGACYKCHNCGATSGCS